MAGGALRTLLNRLGKGERKVAAVFGCLPEECHAAVLHLRHGAPEIPIWLFSNSTPFPETAELCERVHVSRGPALLLLEAQAALRPDSSPPSWPMPLETHRASFAERVPCRCWLD